MIGSISGSPLIYPVYQAMPVSPVQGVGAVAAKSDGVSAAAYSGMQGVGLDNKTLLNRVFGERVGSADEEEPTKLDKRVGKAECETCKNRKYVDGSDDPCVSFKTPAHIDPGASASAVMGHEKEHVNHAVKEGNEPNKKLVSSSVTLHTSICPECGRVYVSGGVTHTQMKTTSGGDDSKKFLEAMQGASQNPYVREQRKQLSLLGAGLNLDMTA